MDPTESQTPAWEAAVGAKLVSRLMEVVATSLLKQ